MSLLDIFPPNAEAQLTAMVKPVADAQIDVMNQTANNIAARAYQLSPVANPNAIERDLLREIRVSGGGTRPLANLIVSRPGQTANENAIAARKLVEKSKRASGYSRSGWAQAVREMNLASPRKNALPPRAAQPSTGRGIPARKGFFGGVAIAIVQNLVVLHGPRAAKAELKRVQALRIAIALENAQWQRQAQRQAEASILKINK